MISASLLKAFFLRFAIALISVSLVTLYFIWQPYLSARKLADGQRHDVEKTQQALTAARKTLDGLISPSDLPLQDPRTARAYADDASKASEAVSVATLDLPASLRTVPFQRAGSKLIRQVNQILSDPATGKSYTEAGAALKTADMLLTYHAAMSLAVANVLDYNPTMDFQQFDLNSEDTRGRIAAAQDGLRKTSERVEEARKLYDDPTSEEIVRSIQVVQQELDLLEKSGDLGRFSSEFKKQQEIIRANRAAFWLVESKNIIAQLSEAVANLGKVSERWSSIRR